MKGTKCEPILTKLDVRWVMVLALMVCSALSMAANAIANESSQQQDTRRFTYSWQFHSDSQLAPRGGTTRGAGVTRAPQPNAAWLGLTEDGLSAYERDRLAILAMAGEYQASFDFIETIGFEDGYVPKAPYQSWGTEYIFVVEDRGPFISLQHILVMIVQMPDGSMSEPMTMKHWRQDWTFEDTEMNVFVGNNTWEPKSIPAAVAAGTWTQTVYQVDDSPRYESFGEWVHKAGTSFWQSGQTRRPVPRRETSVRKDYDYLLGTNRHTITPRGWIQEEDNLKVHLLKSPAKSGDPEVVLAREAGLNRYEKIVDFDFSPARAYWASTERFWDAINARWRQILGDNKGYRLEKHQGQSFLMSVLLEGDRVSRTEVADEEIEQFADQLFQRFVKVEDR